MMETCKYCKKTTKHDRRICRMKALHQDPEFAKASSERMKALNQDPEFAKAHSKRMKALHANPEFNKLAALSASERSEYDALKKKKRVSAGHPR